MSGNESSFRTASKPVQNGLLPMLLQKTKAQDSFNEERASGLPAHSAPDIRMVAEGSWLPWGGCQDQLPSRVRAVDADLNQCSSKRRN